MSTSQPTQAINAPNTSPTIQAGGKTTLFTPLFNSISYLNHHVMYLNNSKFFAGVVMILLNVGSKFIQIQFSKSTEEYMKYSVSKQLLVFSMAWMGTRDIYTALGLTAVFTILSEYLFNEESSLCIVPHQYRVLHKLMDTNDDGVVTEPELAAAIAVLEKAKREKQRKAQKDAYAKFDFERFTNG
ncbi:MAG: hypothetical protein ACOVRN_00620 [Flavobacterium sp.]